MKVYAVMRRYGRGMWTCGEPQVYKLFDTKAAAQAFIASKNPNACSYEYSLKLMTVESSLPKPPAM